MAIALLFFKKCAFPVHGSPPHFAPLSGTDTETNAITPAMLSVSE
jgi:hypothetical protein